MFTKHNRTLRYAARQCKTGPASGEKTSQRTQPFQAYRPPETGLKAALWKLIAHYTAIHNARRLPCQIFWDFLFGGRSDNRKIQENTYPLSAGSTAMKCLSGMQPKKGTKGTGLYTAKSREVKVQEEDAGNVQEAGKDFEITEEAVENCAKVNGTEDSLQLPRHFPALPTEDVENTEVVEDAEKRVGDAEDVEREARKGVKRAGDIKKSEDWDQDVGYGNGDVDGDVDGDVEEDIEEDIEEDVEEDFQEDVEDIEEAIREMKGRRCGLTPLKPRSDGKDVEEHKSLGVRVNDSDYTGTMYPYGPANTTKDFQDREAVDQRAEPPMSEMPRMEPAQSVPTGFRNTTTQAMSTLEEIKISLSHLSSLADQRPKRTALGTRNFVTYVLNPRGIRINTEEAKAESAFEHFQSVEPLPGSNFYRHYTQLSGLRSSTLWINPTDDVIQSIHSNYSEMHQSVPNALCEPEWVDDAVKFLLKSEPRRKLQPKPGSLSQWLPVRMREESFRPQDGGVWDMPPIVHRDIPVDPTFNFNVQPDCSYWIWTGGFRPEINGKLISLTSVRFRRSLCPYLTIEVKKDTKNSSKGRQQIAVAASTALYNRWRLRESYLRKAGAYLGRNRFSDVRHYGLLLAGVRFEIWCLRPHNTADKSYFSTNSWTGCGMQKVHSGDLDTNTGIKDCINWINEIHCWGNTRHSSGCARDIESRLLPQEKMLTSTMAPLALVVKNSLHMCPMENIRD